MVIYRTGDVVEAFKKGEIDVLVHGVNCQGKMNSGIAKQIRAEFPQVFNEYESKISLDRVCFNKHEADLLGDAQFVTIEGYDKQWIINAFTQDTYGYNGQKFCSYDAIDKVMDKLARVAIGRVAMPKIGAGLGGGDWKVIEAIINSHFKDRDVYVYEL